MRQKVLASVTAALMAVVALSFNSKGGGESSSNVHTVDSPTVPTTNVEPRVGTGPPSIEAELPTPLVVSAPQRPVATPQSPREARAGTGLDAALPLSVVHDFVDPAGDARYHQCQAHCPEQASTGFAPESQSKVDVVAVDMYCVADVIVADVTVLDLSAPLAPNQHGAAASQAAFLVGFAFESEEGVSLSLIYNVEQDTWRGTWMRGGPMYEVDLEIIGSTVRAELPAEWLPWSVKQQGAARVSGSTAVSFESVPPFSNAYTDLWDSGPEPTLTLCP